MAQFVMPKLSDTMEEGTILQWLAADGDAVEKGQPIVEIETDKANMTVEAPESGALRLLAAEGDVLAVGEPIAEIGEGAAPAAADEEPASTCPTTRTRARRSPSRRATPSSSTTAATSAPRSRSATTAPRARSAPSCGPEETYPGAREADEAEAGRGRRPSRARARAEAPSRDGGGERAKASPLARRLAGRARRGHRDRARHGPRRPHRARRRRGGRPRRRGRPAARRPRPRPAPRGAPAPARRPRPAAARPASACPSRGCSAPSRRGWSPRSTEAPQFALQRDVDATEAVALRRQLVEAAPEGEGPSLNDLIVRAVAMAAAEQPEAVSRFDGDALVRPDGDPRGHRGGGRARAARAGDPRRRPQGRGRRSPARRAT